jgi:hypothetical protein
VGIVCGLDLHRRQITFDALVLDAVLAEMRGDEQPTKHRHRQQGAAS